MKALAIVGFKKSGKTTLCTELAAELERRGVSVCSAKFTHSDLDKPNTDTAKLSRVSSSVIGLSDEAASMFWKGKKYLPDMIPLSGADFLLVEGGKHLGWLPRVIIPKEEDDVAKLDNGTVLGCWDYAGCGYQSISSVSKLADLALEKGFMLPGLDCGTCGRETCLDLGKEIVSGVATTRQCMALRQNMSISINDQPLAMNGFVNSIISGVLKGILAEMKGYTPGCKVDIKMR